MRTKPSKRLLELTINGETYELAVEPQETLSEVLRNRIGLTGVKEGCGTGECGSCTVLVEGEPVLGCLLLAVECERKRVETIEGQAEEGVLTPVQQAFLEKGAVQCGFCTPGMVLASTALLKRRPNPSEEEIQEALEGHLCRCTGYNKIMEAVLHAASSAADKR
ncbi:(2Fe-2S)-binding protein [Desulfatiglans anilini]|uniref:(2Fe-2S)-binding protein n=1 Tax=Desulfatiglans anilini TaxID=90728 RepID=UPI000419687C|nr:(2Fe-2S)-binding protein [Desulfatiglans anilini]